MEGPPASSIRTNLAGDHPGQAKAEGGRLIGCPRTPGAWQPWAMPDHPDATVDVVAYSPGWTTEYEREEVAVVLADRDEFGGDAMFPGAGDDVPDLRVASADGHRLLGAVDDVARLEQVATEVVVEPDTRPLLGIADLRLRWETQGSWYRLVDAPEFTDHLAEVAHGPKVGEADRDSLPVEWRSPSELPPTAGLGSHAPAVQGVGSRDSAGALLDDAVGGAQKLGRG